MTPLIQSALMGVVEGATEFLPISSTGHLILAGEILKFQGPASSVFEVVIQLGAILAIVVLYFAKLWGVLVTLPSKRESQMFAASVLVAFAPAVVLGLALHDIIKQALFNPTVVCVALIVGGLAIMGVEKIKPEPKTQTVDDMTLLTALKIGAAQCLALIPGVSRAGATILGAMMFGVNRKAAAEFSFFLAIPTMVGASALDLFKARNDLTTDGLSLIAVGFAVSFVVALVVVKWLVGFISRHGFVPFAWYRIALGTVGLAALYLM